MFMPILEEPWFNQIKRPSRYLGGEINAVKKDPSKIEVSIALIFPDVYEVGMSHLGLKILYHILNEQEWLVAERAFSPWSDLESEMRERGIPLTTLESDRPLSSFDLIGFSLQHELCYTNILTMLALSGIPFFSRERDDPFPLILAGGPACVNPEPVADFFDLMVIGDGEASLLEICRQVRKAKKEKTPRKADMLNELRHISGVYIPSFFRSRYQPDGRIRKIEPLHPDYTGVRRAILPDIDRYPYPVNQIVPFTQLVHDRLAVEVSRGCTRGCRFCQAGMIYRPVRERSLKSVMTQAEAALGRTGYDEMSLLSLSAGDYSAIGPLLHGLMDRQASQHIGVSLPSLRVDTLDRSVVEEIRRVRKTGFTLAPEAGNDRLRRVLNKGFTQEQILDTARIVYDAGWQLIKLYFMIGLPTERDQDLLDLVQLVKQISRLSGKKGRKPSVNVSVSTFVPKAHTPFMWCPQIPLAESHRRIRLIQEKLKRTRVKIKWNQPELSWLEGIFARGDRRLSGAIVAAWRGGARFDSWGECFRMDTWKAAFDDTDISPDFYLTRERHTTEILPWDHIHSGVKKRFFIREWDRAMAEKLTPDCRHTCLECGVCDHKRLDPLLHSAKDIQPNTKSDITKRETIPDVAYRYRLTFTKERRARYLSHLELVQVFVRAFRRAGLRVAHSKGYHPMPKLSFFSALPVGTGSLKEIMDVEFLEKTAPSYLRDRLLNELPQGIQLIQIEQILRGRKRPRLKETHYRITLSNGRFDEGRAERFMQSDEFVVVKSSRKGDHEIDARPLVKSMTVGGSVLRLCIRNRPSGEGPGLNPKEIVKGVFELTDDELFEMYILKTDQVLL